MLMKLCLSILSLHARQNLQSCRKFCSSFISSINPYYDVEFSCRLLLLFKAILTTAIILQLKIFLLPDRNILKMKSCKEMKIQVLNHSIRNFKFSDAHIKSRTLRSLRRWIQSRNMLKIRIYSFSAQMKLIRNETVN